MGQVRCVWVVGYGLIVYRFNYEEEEQMALNEENNSNEQPSAGAVAIQIVLCNGHTPPCYRISHISHTCGQTAIKPPNAMASQWIH